MLATNDYKFYFIVFQNNSYRELSADDLHKEVEKKIIQPPTSIWSSIQGEWLDLDKWMISIYPMLTDYIYFSKCKWSLKIKDLVLNDLSFSELLTTILDVDLSTVELKITEDTQSNFSNITNFPIISLLSFSLKRTQKRYPLKGWIKTINPVNNLPLMGSIRDIGLGGIGIKINKAPAYKRGNIINLDIVTDALPRGFSCEGKVVHISQKNSLIGVEFTNIYDDGVEMLNDYFLSLEAKS